MLAFNTRTLKDCNRTYYAAVGESYRLLVNWPKPSQMPFLCYLTFSSATHDPADLLQVRLPQLMIIIAAPARIQLTFLTRLPSCVIVKTSQSPQVSSA